MLDAFKSIPKESACLCKGHALFKIFINQIRILTFEVADKKKILHNSKDMSKHSDKTNLIEIKPKSGAFS